jgi:hypothetical protein
MGHNEMTYVQAAAADESFQKRMRQIERRHSQLSKGYLMTVTHDGLVVPQPRRVNLRLPLRALVATAVAVLLFKSLALAVLGGAAYDTRISTLSSGTFSERLGAVFLQSDPVSRFVGDQLSPYFR